MPHTAVFGRKLLYVPPMLKGRKLTCHTPWGQTMYVINLKHFRRREISLSTPFIYLYQYRLMDVVLVWHINQYYFISCSNCSSFGHWELFGLIQWPLWSTYINMRCLFACPFIFLAFYFYGTVKMSMADLVYFMLQPFLRKSGSFID